MYAVIQSGGKQHRVQPGDVIQIEKIEPKLGEKTQFSEVLLIAQPGGEADPTQIWLGKPLLSGASVDGEIVGQGRGEKIVMVKMKRRKQYRRTQGHRQEYTQVLITGIRSSSASLELTAEERKQRLSKFSSNLKKKEA